MNEIIVVHESLAESIIKDVVSFSVLLAVVGIGIWLQSVPLQWIAGLLWIVWLLSKALGRSHKMTVSEARKFLDELEAKS